MTIVLGVLAGWIAASFLFCAGFALGRAWHREPEPAPATIMDLFSSSSHVYTKRDGVSIGPQ